MMALRLIIIRTLVCTLSCLLDYSEAQVCQEVQIEHGSMSVRGRGRVAQVRCNSNYSLIDGDDQLKCSNGSWDSTIPKCVGTGCPDLEDVSHGYIETLIGGAMQKFHCHIGYTLKGSPSLACNGSNWNSTVPTCIYHIAPSDAARTCSFEEEDWCGWKLDVGVNSWHWRKGGPVQPGSSIPPTDHTTGNDSGHFLYIDIAESHSNTKLHSPVFSPLEDNITCFVFYYHFKPSTTGNLTLHLLNEDTSNKTVVKNLMGQSRIQHVTEWSMFYIDLTHMVTSVNHFQLVLEVKPGSGYNSDTAIDDVTLTSGTSCIKHAQEWQKQEDSQTTSLFSTAQHSDTDDTYQSESSDIKTSTRTSVGISTLITEPNSTQVANITQTSSYPDLSTLTDINNVSKETTNSLPTGFDRSEKSTETSTISKHSNTSYVEQTTNVIPISSNSSGTNGIKSTVSMMETSPSSEKSSDSIITEQTTTKQSKIFSTQPVATMKSTASQVNTISNTLKTTYISTITYSSTEHSDDIVASSVSKGTIAFIAFLVVVCIAILGVCIVLRQKKKRRKHSGHERLLDEQSYSEGAIQFQEARVENSDDDRRESEVLVSYKAEDHLDDDSV